MLFGYRGYRTPHFATKAPLHFHWGFAGLTDPFGEYVVADVRYRPEGDEVGFDVTCLRLQ